MSGWETHKEEPKRKLRTVRGKNYELVDNDEAFNRALSKKKQDAMRQSSIVTVELTKEAMDEMAAEALDKVTLSALVQEDAVFSGLGMAMTEVFKTVHNDLSTKEELVFKLMTKVMRKIMESKELGEMIEVLKDDKA